MSCKFGSDPEFFTDGAAHFRQHASRSMRHRTAIKTGRTAELQLEALRGHGYRAIVQRLSALLRRFF